MKAASGSVRAQPLPANRCRPSWYARERCTISPIWAYIADDSVDRADAFAALIDRKFQTLSRRPGIGRARPELATDLRSFAVGNHVIFHLPIANGVEIVRVLHGARDLEAVLGDDAR